MAMELLESRRLLSFVPFGHTTVVPVGTLEQFENLNFDLAVAGNGGFIVATSIESGNAANKTEQTQIHAVRYTPAGVQAGEPLLIAAIANGSSSVSASADADGDAVVAYVDRSTPSASIDSVFFRRISKDGAVSAPVKVATAATADEGIGSQQVSMDPSGGFYLAWFTTSMSDGDFGQTLHVRASK